MEAMNASKFSLIRDHAFSGLRLPSPVLRTRATPLPEMTLVSIKMMFSNSKAAFSLSPSKAGVFRTGSLSPVRLSVCQLKQRLKMGRWLRSDLD